MDSGNILKNFFTNLIQTSLAEIAALVGNPDIADITTVDAFSAEKHGSEQHDGAMEKFGMDKRAARIADTIDLRGEVVKEADQGKIYAKLMRDGHVGDTRHAEEDLREIFDDLDNGASRQTPSESHEQPQVFTPVAAVLHEINDTLLPLIEDEPEPENGGNHTSAEDENDDDEGDDAESECEPLTIEAKMLYQKVDTFA